MSKMVISTTGNRSTIRTHDGLSVDELALADALHSAGYRKANIGKWLIGSELISLSEHHGFDVNIAGNPHRSTWQLL